MNYRNIIVTTGIMLGSISASAEADYLSSIVEDIRQSTQFGLTELNSDTTFESQADQVETTDSESIRDEENDAYASDIYEIAPMTIELDTADPMYSFSQSYAFSSIKGYIQDLAVKIR